jgi:multimeric flavodoxin WrbA
MLAEKAKEADAMIVAGYTPYSSLDARTKAFIERLYPLRHQKGVMRNNPGGIIVTCV